MTDTSAVTGIDSMNVTGTITTDMRTIVVPTMIGTIAASVLAGDDGNHDR